MAIIALVRHGENEWVKEHRLAGWIEGVHLNDTGRKQAAQAAARLAHLPITTVYSSPVARCVETATFVAQPHQLELVLEEAIGEVRYGEWEGEKIEKLAKLPEWQTVQHFPSRMTFPGGEAMRDVQSRAVAKLEELAQIHQNEMIVVCSHADLIKMVLAHYLGVHLDLFQRIQVSPASISVLALMEKGGVRLLRLNDTGPIPMPPKPSEEKEEKKKENEAAADSEKSEKA